MQNALRYLITTVIWGSTWLAITDTKFSLFDYYTAMLYSIEYDKDAEDILTSGNLVIQT